MVLPTKASGAKKINYLVKIDGQQKKLKIVRSNQQSNGVEEYVQ